MTSWVLIDDTSGAPTTSGEVITPTKLARMAEALTIQANRDYAPECGGSNTVYRAGANAKDIQPGEYVFSFVPTLPDASGALAYHSIDGVGVPFAFEAVDLCDTVLGLGESCSAAASHEGCETEGDKGCNGYKDDDLGTEHAEERCDAVEAQSYAVLCQDGTSVGVSNFLLDAWFIPGTVGPYDFMTKAGLPGAIAPPGPFQTAPANGGNYQVERTSPTNATQVTAKHAKAVRITGSPRKPAKVAHWSSRASRRMKAAA